MVRQLDAVDVRLVDGRVRAQRVGDFGRAYVFALPAESVADAVAEVPSALPVPAHDVPRAEPRVALFQHVAHDFALGRFVVVEVALEFAADVGGVDFVEQLARFAAGDFAAEVVQAGVRGVGDAEGLFAFPVQFDDGELGAEEGGGEEAVAADGSGREVVGA